MLATRQTGVKALSTYHHDPAHTDLMLDGTHAWLLERANGLEIIAGKPGVVIALRAASVVWTP